MAWILLCYAFRVILVCFHFLSVDYGAFLECIDHVLFFFVFYPLAPSTVAGMYKAFNIFHRMSEWINDLWESSVLISENFLISGPQIINEVILQVMGLVLLYIVPNFSLVRCLQTYFLCVSFSPSNCELISWCRGKSLAWIQLGFEFWYCLLPIHLPSLLCKWECPSPVLLGGPRNIWSIQFVQYFFFFFAKIDSRVRWGTVINEAINLVWNKEIWILSWLDQAAF